MLAIIPKNKPTNKIYASIEKPENKNTKKNFWKFKSFLNKENKKEAEILLYGVIGDDGYWDEVTSKEFAEQLKEVEDAETISVRINSPGGDVFAGQAIYSMLKRCKAQIVVYIDGLAASIASLVAMAGDKIIMPKNSMMMIHKPWTISAGNANDMRQQADTLDKVEESMLAAYVEKTGLAEDEIKQLLADETWLTASMALEKGFCDEIEENEVKALINNDCLEINGQKFDIKKYKNFKTDWFKNKDLGAKDGEVKAEEKPAGLKKDVSINGKTKGNKKMDLKKMCEAYGLDYDSLINAGMTDAQIKAMISAKMQEEDGEGGNNEAAIKAKADAQIKAEKDRVATIIKLGEEYNAKEKALDFVKDNKTVDQFKDELLKGQSSDQKPLNSNFGVGLTLDEARNFSFVNLINALANPSDHYAQDAAQKEFEMCARAKDKYGAKNKGLVIPVEALVAPMLPKASLDTTAGGATIETKLLTGSFIELLRNKSVIMQLARQLTGLVGNIDIPKQTAGASAYWVGEDTAPTTSNATFGTLQLRMKTVAANTYITRTMLKQSSMDLENFVRQDIALALALAIDKAAFYGTGTSNQPKGIKNTDGINVVKFASAQPTYAELVKMETEIGADNAAVEDMAYVFNAKTKGHCKTTLKSTGVSGYIWESDNKVNGYKALVTNQIADGDVFLGNFADLILGMFGGLELIVDPYTYSNKGGVQITAFQDVDYGARHAASFCLGANTASTSGS